MRPGMTFIRTIGETLAAAPQRVALVDDAGGGEREPREVRAGELLARAAAMRAGLRARGIGRGQRVVLVGAASSDWVAADLAVLAEGAVLVPLDPRQPAAERSTLQADAAPALLVVLDPAHGQTGSTTADGLARMGGAAAWTPPVEVEPSAPATIIYTSGSSGRPKGVVISRGNLAFMLARTTRRLAELVGAGGGAGGDPDRLPPPARGEERALQALPPCYAGSRVCLLSALLRGARVGLVPDPKRLGHAFTVERPHYTLVVPLILERVRRGARDGIAAKGPLAASALAALEAAWDRLEAAAEASARGRVRDRALVALGRRTLLAPVRAKLGGRLRGIVCGSAPLDPATQRFIRLLGIEVYQGYGLTETTALCTLDREGQVRPGFVGPALPGVELRLDDDGQLLTRGPHVVAGYWRGPDRPLDSPAREGWWPTGDLAEQDAQGRWRILGRVDAQLALSTGHKVAPEVVEEALRARLGPDAQVVVLGHGLPHLVALVAGATREAVTGALAAHHAEAAPHRRVHAYELLPGPLTVEDGLLTPNLKLRRRAIAERHSALVARLCAGGIATAITGGARA